MQRNAKLKCDFAEFFRVALRRARNLPGAGRADPLRDNAKRNAGGGARNQSGGLFRAGGTLVGGSPGEAPRAPRTRKGVMGETLQKGFPQFAEQREANDRKVRLTGTFLKMHRRRKFLNLPNLTKKIKTGIILKNRVLGIKSPGRDICGGEYAPRSMGGKLYGSIFTYGLLGPAGRRHA